MLIEIIKNIVLGMVQGLSEFLPISSSGHIKLFQTMFGYSGESNLFVSIMLHLGTLVAVLIVYHRTIGDLICEGWYLVIDLCKGRFSFKTMNSSRRMLIMLILATAMLGIMIIPFGENSLKDYIEMLNGCESLVPLGFAFLVTGVLLISTFYFNKYRGDSLHSDATVKDALIIGGTQCIATISGISRSGSTMASGLLCGLSREYMVKFSFIMSIPAIMAAALSDAKDAIAGEITVDWIPLFFGIFSAMFFGILAIKLIEWLIKKDRYSLFGYYCLALGLFVLIYSLI